MRAAMRRKGSDQPKRGGTSRLIYGTSGAIRHSPLRTSLNVALARGVDQGLGLARLAEPVLLISGFWRSGTTWLQESVAARLCGKTVFEPLSPMEPMRRAALARLYPDDTEDLCQATIPGPQPEGSAFWSYLDRTCCGRTSSTYLMSCRRNVAESFRRAIVVKDVRLQANLAEFHRHYRVPVVHVRRHPCGVAASLVAADWHWSFARTPLATLLPRLGQSLSDGERDAALRFDTDALSRIAAFWAVTERLATASLKGQTWGAVVFYERFAAAPQSVLTQLCGTLGLKQRGSVDFSEPSASVSPEAFAAYGARPSERWRGLLSPEQIEKIGSVVDTLYPDWRNALDERSS